MDKLLELNQLVATDLNTLGYDPSESIALETELMAIEDQFFTQEEEQGFLVESDELEYINKLKPVVRKLVKLIVVKEMLTV